MKNKLLLLIAFFSLTFINVSLGEVEPPNYDFSLNKLQIFYPGKIASKIPKDKHKPHFVEEKDGIILTKYQIKHVRYIFDVFVHSKAGIIQDFFTRLPTYFLHDLFHQSLINRYKKQDQYKNYQGQAIYIWNKVGNMKLSYAAGCTITCFPIYLSGELIGSQSTSYLKSIKENLKKTNSKLDLSK